MEFIVIFLVPPEMISAGLLNIKFAVLDMAVPLVRLSLIESASSIEPVEINFDSIISQSVLNLPISTDTINTGNNRLRERVLSNLNKQKIRSQQRITVKNSCYNQRIRDN